MIVTSGLSAEQPDGSWRKLHVVMEDCDIKLLMEEGEAAVVKKFRAASVMADKLLLMKLASEGIVPIESARQQIQSLGPAVQHMESS